MTSRRSRRKVQELGRKEGNRLSRCLVGQEEEQICQGKESLRGGPGCLKGASLPSRLFLVCSGGETNLDKRE